MKSNPPLYLSEKGCNDVNYMLQKGQKKLLVAQVSQKYLAPLISACGP